jgi:serine/threonine protein kinase
VEQKTLGRYRILGELGRGAMGAVYKALDPLIEREVAIKTLLPNVPDDAMQEVRERFIREARSAGRLNHPNIVTIFDVGEHEGMAYIAMEFLTGHSLQQILRHPQRLGFNTIANLAAQVADALDHAQRYSIVHRDVKPANVMVDSAGRAKLTDFGVAYIPSSTMTQAGTALGSPRYMSPEQVMGQPVDPRADIFSLGVMLYEMLTKRTPFERQEDTTVFALMNRIAGAPHIPLREVDPSVPEAFEHIIERALAKKPGERYQRAGEMARDLRDFRHLNPAAARPAGPRTPDSEKTASVSAVRPRSAEDDRVRTQLITDLDKFVEQYDREEQQRLKEAEAERQRKDEQTRRWADEQQKKRDEFERSNIQPAPAMKDSSAASSADSTAKGRALELLRKQAAAQPPREDPAVLRAKGIAALDATMRETFKYLAELVSQVNGVMPRAQKPYEFIYLGKLPTVTLGDAFVDSRPRRIDGKDVTDHIFMRYRITPTQPARASLLGDDIPRCEQYLKLMNVAFQQRPLAKNDFGKITRAEITVTGSLPCEINVRADYEANRIGVELTNVRRLGRVQYQFPSQEFGDAVDDLARYMLGADDDFEKLVSGKKP